MANESLTRAKYAGFDFDTLLDDLRARIQIKFAASFNDFAVSSMGMLLLDSVAFGLDTLSFYLDQRATDAYLTTARTRSAVSRHTRMLGYKMRPASASSLDVQVSLKQVYGFPITIPTGFQFQGPNSVVFEAAQDITIPANTATTATFVVSCYQGESQGETFISEGSANQLFTLRRVPTDQFVVSGSAKVVVDGVSYVESDFITFDATNQFEVGYHDLPVTVGFGDGNAGTIPATGASITVNYITSKGKAGRVTKGAVTKEVTSLVVNFQTISLKINNPAGSVGGDDPESMEEAKALAPRRFATRDVAVTQSDYEVLAGSFSDSLYGRVAVAQAFSTRGAAADVDLGNNITNIGLAVSSPIAAVGASVTDGLSKSATITTQAAAILTAATAIQASADDADSRNSTALANVRSIKNATAEITSDSAQINVMVNNINGTAYVLVNGFGTTGGATSMNTADKAALLAYLASVKGYSDDIASYSATASTSTTAAISAIGGITDDLYAIGTTAATTALAGKVYAITQAKSAADTANALIVTDLNSCNTQVTGAYASVQTYLTNISNRFNDILSNDCKTNVVTVPILSKDSSGFYAAPSVGLLTALQQFLEARKEVTQTVVVTSGASFLVPAKMTVRLGVLPNYSLSVVQAAVASKIDGLLRDRKFGSSLYVSDVWVAIKDMEGVGFANVVINGYTQDGGITAITTKNDASGNLIAQDQDIITKGAVVITPEAIKA